MLFFTHTHRSPHLQAPEFSQSSKENASLLKQVKNVIMVKVAIKGDKFAILQEKERDTKKLKFEELECLMFTHGDIIPKDMHIPIFQVKTY